MGRWLAGFFILAGAAIALSMLVPTGRAAAADDLAFFYCYAPDPQSHTNYVSDVHPVGDLLERGRYGRRFEDYLRIKGKLGLNTQAFCVMRATMREINAGRMALRNEPCRECAGIDKVEDVVWPQPDRIRVPALQVGTATKPVATKQPDIDRPPVREPEPQEIGAFIMGRQDEIDVVVAMNELDAADQVKAKAASVGGKWKTLLNDDRCPGWIAVAFVKDGKAHDYYVARGAASETEASDAALALADRYGPFEPDHKGVFYTGLNKVEKPGLSLDEHFAVINSGPISAAKFWLRRILVSGCNSSSGRSGGNGGVRG